MYPRSQAHYHPPTRDYHSQRSVQDREVRISKFLTLILRHSAKEMGVSISPDGWIAIPEILNLQHSKDLQLTQEEILNMVKNNDKQRFSTKMGVQDVSDPNSPPTPTSIPITFIKANQGHSMEEVHVELTKITNASEYPVVVHGTYYRFWELIKKSGLSKMKRNHIHMAIGEYGSASVISGMRSSCEIMIYINITQAIQDGIEFFVSPNKVVLSSGVDGYLQTKYFEKVVDVKTKQRLDIVLPTEKEKIPEKIVSEKKIERVIGAYFDPKEEKKLNKKVKKPAATKGEGSQTPASENTSTSTTTKSEADEESDSLKKSNRKGGKGKKATKAKEEGTQDSPSPIPGNEETSTTSTIPSTIAEPEEKPSNESKKVKQQGNKNKKSKKEEFSSSENVSVSSTTTPTIDEPKVEVAGEVVGPSQNPKKNENKKNKSKKEESTEESSPPTPTSEDNKETTASTPSITKYEKKQSEKAANPSQKAKANKDKNEKELKKEESKEDSSIQTLASEEIDISSKTTSSSVGESEKPSSKNKKKAKKGKLNKETEGVEAEQEKEGQHS